MKFILNEECNCNKVNFINKLTRVFNNFRCQKNF